jgi:nucleotide-binding universal stress UspA family protein
MTIKRVLIGIDDSKFAEHAAEYGFDIAHKFKAAVGLVNIVEPIIIPQTLSGTDTLTGMSATDTSIEEMEILDVRRSQSKSIIDQAIEKFAGDIQVTQFHEYGSTADGIINCSKEFGADLIVIGTHSRTGLDRLLMGSVAEHVVRHSEIPVLVVPFKGE